MDGVDLSTTVPPSASELRDLFAQTTWASGRSEDDLGQLVRTLDVFVCARVNGRLVGFGRAISDGLYRALLDDVVVDEGARGAGVGHAVVRSLMEQLAPVEEVFLNANEGLAPFYEADGFEPFGGLTMVYRKRG